MPTVSIISAFASNHVMGYKGLLPWDLPDDWAFFKEITQGKAFLMGRKSFESEDYLGSSYKNFILTSKEDLDLKPNSFIVHSIPDFLAEVSEEEEVFILGGGTVFEQALALGIVDKMYLTRINANPVGDTFFPSIDWSKWEEIKTTYHPKDERHAHDFYFKTYVSI